MNKIMTLLLVLLAAGWMQASQADVEGLDESAIKAVLQKQTHSYYQRNYEGEADVWAHQPYILKMGSTGEPLVGWDTIGANYKTSMEENPEPFDREFTHSDFHIQINGDGAWVVFKQHVEGTTEEGEPFSWDSRQVRILARIDGKWKVVYQGAHDIGQSDQD